MDLEKHFEQLERWLALESSAEAERIAARNLLKDSKAAESTGETLLDLVIADSESDVGDRSRFTLIKRNREQSLPWNRFRMGTPVLISQHRVDQPEKWNAVVTRIKRDWIQIAGPSWIEGDHFRIDFAADEITRQRAMAAMEKAKNAKGRLSKLCQILNGQLAPEFSTKIAEISWLNSNLNSTQQDAIRFALSANDLAVIHGPLGTGKTTTVVELIAQSAYRGDKVLVCAPSNTAVDNLVTKLLQFELRPVRLGHPARITETLHSQTLDSLVLGDPNMRVAQEMIRESDELFRKLDRYTRARPEPGQKREMLQDAKRLRKDAKLMEKQAVKHVLDETQIICSTCTLDEAVLGDLEFNLLVIDESCQSTETTCWIPIVRSEKIVLAGDHQQLPPTILSKRAADEGFDLSLMERQVNLYGDQVTKMLDVQYRMNDSIMGFSSQQFYDGKLQSHPSVAGHRLGDLYGLEDRNDLNQPLTFIDTAGASWHEEQEPCGESKLNPKEAEFAIEQTATAVQAGVPIREISIIAPYSAQVRLIRQLAETKFGENHALEIDTVDGFQGREKEVVLISLVRSNEKCEVGFLADRRRMNVAMTRARRKLLLFGDSATIGGQPFFKEMLEYFESNSAYRTIWEFSESI